MFRIHTVYNDTILVNEDGTPISLSDDYAEIVKFDIDGLRDWCKLHEHPLKTDWHIFGVGYWTTEGKYVQPLDWCHDVYHYAKDL